MLPLERVQVGARSGHAHRLARNDEAAEILEKTRELRVASRLRDRPMKEIILVDRGFIAGDGAIHGGKRLADAAELLRGRALRRQAGRLDLDGHAKLHEVDDGVERLEPVGVDPGRPALRVARNEGPEPLTRGDQALSAKRRY